MVMERDIFETMQDDLHSAKIPEDEKNKLMRNLLTLRKNEINLLITGATGCGKSSTINALFDTDKAKIGTGADPETMKIDKYNLKNLILWDSPGLGDGKEADEEHSKGIIELLNKTGGNGEALIDLVLVILDGSTRDLGTSYGLINEVIIPNLGGNNKEGRILVAINQADAAMKGRYWDKENNKPERPLIDFLEEKVQSVRNRIKEGTGVDIEPIYYSAGFKEDGELQERPYNLSKLMYFIIKNTPTKKRLAYVDTISRDDNVWRYNDTLKDYNKEIKLSFAETLKKDIASGADIGGDIGKIFGSAGETIGRTAGAIVGGVVGTAKAFWNSIFS
ncbi:GTPase [Synergistales bacterium]|nr:GTPase [Synergistales bacterium]